MSLSRRRFVAGTGREIALVDAGQRKELDLEVVVPVEDMRELNARSGLGQPVMPAPPRTELVREQRATSLWAQIWRRFRRHKLAMIGATILVVLVALAVAAPWVALSGFSFGARPLMLSAKWSA